MKDYLIPVATVEPTYESGRDKTVELVRRLFAQLVETALKTWASPEVVLAPSVRERYAYIFFPEEEFRTQEFVEAVDSGEIIQRVKKKRPQQIELIERELEPLYS